MGIPHNTDTKQRRRDLETSLPSDEEMAGKMDDPSTGEHCSILLTDLPQEWFQLKDPYKVHSAV